MAELIGKVWPERRHFFRRDLLHSIGSSGVTFAIMLVTTPLTTRVFSAEAYGVNGMMLTAATILSAFGLFGLPMALAREQAGREQTRLLHASGQLAVVLSAIVALGVVGVLLVGPQLPQGISGVVLWLFPLLVLGHAAQRVSDSLGTARGLFPPLAAARVAGTGVARGLTLGLGWLVHAGAATMVLGDVAGRVVHLAVATHRGGLWPVWRRVRWRPRPSALRRALIDYRDFALHSNVASILPLVTGLGIQALIGIRFGTDSTGQYVLAQSIITLPVSLIALASAPVVFHRLVRASDETPERLPRLALRAMLGFALVGAACMLPVALFGPALFGFFFGEAWRPAGVAAAALSLPQVLAFSLTGLLSLFQVMRRIRAWVAFEAVGTALVLGGFALLPIPTDFAAAALLLALLGLAYQFLMHAGCFWLVLRHAGMRR